MVATRRDFRRTTPLWHNGRLSAARLRPRGGHTREAKPDPGIPPGSLNCSVTHTGESLNHGCEDQAHSAWQNPQSPVPHRRRRRAQPPRRPLHRGHRPLPPEGRAEPDRDQLRARAVLAFRGCSAHRTRPQTAEDHRRLAEVQRPARRRGPAEGQARQAQQAGVVQRRTGGRRGRVPPPRPRGRRRRPPAKKAAKAEEPAAEAAAGSAAEPQPRPGAAEATEPAAEAATETPAEQTESSES